MKTLVLGAASLVFLGGCAGQITGQGSGGGSGGGGSSTMGMGPGGAACMSPDAGPPPGCSCAADEVCDSGGRCLTVIARDQTAMGLALHGGTVYWTTQASESNPSSGTVMSCSAAGCGQQPAVIATGQFNPGPIAADDTGVYWINGYSGGDSNGSVMRCAPGGCSPSPQTLVGGGVGLGGLVLGEGRLFWTTWGSSPLEDSGAVWSCLAGACAPAKVVDVPAYAVVFAAKGATLLGGLAGAKYGVWTCDPGACAPSALTQDGASAAMDDTNAYLAGGIAGAVSACSLGGCNGSPTVLVGGLVGTGPIATDGVNVYFATARMDQTYGVVGSLQKCAVGGCGGTPTTVASLPCGSAPGNIVFDDQHVYWTDLQKRMVLRAPR